MIAGPGLRDCRPGKERRLQTAIGSAAIAICYQAKFPGILEDAESVVVISLTFFLDLGGIRASGGAIYVNSGVLVRLSGDAFRNCSAGVWGGGDDGGCAYLGSVLTGTRIDSCCVDGCGGRYGSFLYVSTSAAVGAKGLSFFDCSNVCGVVYLYIGTMTIDELNTTRCTCDWGSEKLASGFCSDGGSQPIVNFALFSGCGGGARGTFDVQGQAALLFECLFINDTDGAIGHFRTMSGQDELESCFFEATALRAAEYSAGTTLLKNCLFAGNASSTLNFFATGSQRGAATTALVFDTASFLPTCGGVMELIPCSGYGGCFNGDGDFVIDKASFVDVYSAIVWRSLDRTLIVKSTRFDNCGVVSGLGGACDLTGGVQVLTAICANNCLANLGGFAMVKQPKAGSQITNLWANNCAATTRGGAFLLQKTGERLAFDNLNISDCAAPASAAVAMGTQDEISFVGFKAWRGGFAVGDQGRATSCVFVNSTFAPVNGDVFDAVNCRFALVGNFAGIVSLFNCSFAGSSALGGLDAGGNVFDIEVLPPEERCPTPAPKITLMMSPYTQRRTILRSGLFASCLFLLL
jgi:hypothetical protein